MPSSPSMLDLPLTDLAVGEPAVVIGMNGHRGMASRLAAMGISPGARIVVLQNRGRGPVLARVRDTRIALGRTEAGRVIVRPDGASAHG